MATSVKSIFQKYVSPERQLEMKIKALAATLEATGIPREQAIIIARQRLEKQVAIPAMPAAEAGMFTPVNIALAAVIILGVVYFMNPGGKK